MMQTYERYFKTMSPIDSLLSSMLWKLSKIKPYHQKLQWRTNYATLYFISWRIMHIANTSTKISVFKTNQRWIVSQNNTKWIKVGLQGNTSMNETVEQIKLFTCKTSVVVSNMQKTIISSTAVTSQPLALWSKWSCMNIRYWFWKRYKN